MRTFFVAGTDTGVGKTLFACALLECARRLGLRTIALKPVAAGGENKEGAVHNDDVLLLQRHATLSLPYGEANASTLPDALAPHIAARRVGLALAAAPLADACRRALAGEADLALIEGAGGWRVPLNERESMADIPRLLQVPVLLVAGMRLGCLNHTLLSAEAILADGLSLAGWVASCPGGKMDALEENLAALKERLPAPCLGFIPPGTPEPSQAAQYLDWEPLGIP